MAISKALQAAILAACVGAIMLSKPAAAANTPTTSASQYAQTQYPVILVPGIGGAATFSGGALSTVQVAINALLKQFGISITMPSENVDYFYGFKDQLQRDGAKVHVANLERFSSDDAKQVIIPGLNRSGRRFASSRRAQPAPADSTTRPAVDPSASPQAPTSASQRSVTEHTCARHFR
jgi:hypothetical protein